jgi:hypothetical protein
MPGGAASAAAGAEEVSGWKKVLKYFVHFVNIVLPVALAAGGALGVEYSGDADNPVQVVFVGIYMVMFAAVIFIYEMIQLIRNEKLDTFYKKNFGFLYGPVGKGCYYLICGIFAFGLEVPKNTGLGVGVAVAFWGALTVVFGFAVSACIAFESRCDVHTCLLYTCLLRVMSCIPFSACLLPEAFYRSICHFFSCDVLSCPKYSIRRKSTYLTSRVPCIPH